MALTKAQQRQHERQIKYWGDREAAQLVKNIKDEKKYERELKRIYDEIDSFYSRYAKKEGITIAAAKKKVSQLDIEAYERKAKRYVKEKNFSKEANEEMRLYNATMKINRLEMLKANIGLELIAGHDELQKFMGEILQGRTEDELERQAGILGETIQDNAQLAHSIVNASFHNATFSERIWAHQGFTQAELSKLLERGLVGGKNPRELAREITRQFGASRYNAERLMRTELARVQTDAQLRSFEANGFDEYTFIVNGGCCDICKEIAKKNDGHYKVKDAKPGENAPPIHPHCRCSTAAYMDTTEFDKWLNSLDKKPKTVETGKSKAYNRARNRNAYKAIPYEDYTEPMTKKHVRKVMKEMGVSYGKARLRLVNDKELIGRGVFGYTNPNRKEVQFYPDAFMSREELVKTIGHEKVHLDQLEKYGPTNDTAQSNLYEKEARDSEARWWAEYKKVTGYE